MGPRAGALANFAGALAATLLALSASGAEPPSVFVGASSDGVSAKVPNASGDFGMTPQRLTQLDFAAIDALRETAMRGRTGRVRLNLVEGAEFDWIPERTAATKTGYSLSGPLASVEGGTATLVVNGDVAVGSVWTPEGAYRIRTAGRMQVVQRIEPSGAAKCMGLLQARPPTLPEDAAPTASGAEDDGSEIDVLVVYTPQARRQTGGHRAMLAEIDHAVAWTNEAYAASEVLHRVRLVGAIEVDYDQSDRSSDLDRLREQNDGYMDEVHTLRDRLAADVVVLGSTNGGVAYKLDWLDENFSPLAFATARFGDPSVFAHELGHVMGVRHEREVDRANSPFPYSHGYVLRGIGREHDPYSTIMERATGNLPRFSNPRQRFRGVPLGVPGEEPTSSVDGPADAARSMNETRHHTANYRRSTTRCRYRLSAPSAQLKAEGGSYTLHVEADAGCPWTVRSADGFTTVTSAASGTDDGTVAYRVPANEGWEREVALAVVGRMHVALQPGLRPLKPVCERTAKVRELIEAQLDTSCADIAAADLIEVAELVFDGFDEVQPALGDFDGLSNLGYLRLVLPEGGSLPVGVFDGLASVTRLYVRGYDISLRPGSFRGLGNLHRLTLGHNGVQTAPLPQGTFEGMPRLDHMTYYGGRVPLLQGTFEGLSGLRHLVLLGEIPHLPAGALRGLPNLQRLEVDAGADDGTAPTTVELGLFDDLPNLELLELSDLAEVPERLFAGLSRLRGLALTYNAFTSLPAGVFEGLPSLQSLYLDNVEMRHGPTPYRHELSALPPGLFAGLPSLTLLHLGNVGLRELRPSAFREVGETLTHLILDDNALTTLAEDTFDDLPELAYLSLRHNQLAALPPGVFDLLPALYWLQLENNHLTTLPPDVFQNLRHMVDLTLHRNRLAALPHGLLGFRSKKGHYSHRLQYGLRTLTLHGNPGAPFALAFDPVVVSAAWQRPVRVAVRIPQGAPISIEVTLDAVGGRLGGQSATMVPGVLVSDSVAVEPTGQSPIVVRIAGLPGASGDVDCAASIDAGRSCSYPEHTGTVLEAGAPLVLNGVANQPEFDEPAEIDLANVFLEFDDSAIPTFSVHSSDPTVAAWKLTDRLLKLTPVVAGTTTITVTATAGGRTATRAFSLTVPTEERRFMRGWRLMLLNDGEGTQ